MKVSINLGIISLKEDPHMFISNKEAGFFHYLALMRDAQVENYLSCKVPYTDIIEGRVYDIDPNKEVELQDSYNVLELDEKNDVVKKTVFYRVPTSIILSEVNQNVVRLLQQCLEGGKKWGKHD